MTAEPIRKKLEQMWGEFSHLFPSDPLDEHRADVSQRLGTCKDSGCIF